MYESFFQLREKPFSLLPDPGFLFMSRQHQQALTLLEYGLMNQAGFIVLTGEIGSGKTTLMRHLLSRLDASFNVGLISNTHQSLGELMDWVCMAFDLPAAKANKLEKYQTFINFLIATYGKGQRVLLIVDEAQNLGIEKLEELRLLSNINAGKDLVLQLMLLGQPQLRDLLRQPELEQFAQRVTASYHIGPLDSIETEHYIRHRIFIAGGKQDIFTHDACLAVYHYSKGVPRIINLICDTALIYAYGADQHVLDGAAIDEFVASHTPNLMISVDLEREGRDMSSDPASDSNHSGVGTADNGPHHVPPPSDRLNTTAVAKIAVSKALDSDSERDDESKAKGSPTVFSGRSMTLSGFARPPRSEVRSAPTSADDHPNQAGADQGTQTSPQVGSLGSLRSPVRVPAVAALGESARHSPVPSSFVQDRSELMAPLDGSRSPLQHGPSPISRGPATEPSRDRKKVPAFWLSIAGVLLIVSAIGMGWVWLSTRATGDESAEGFWAFLGPIRGLMVDHDDANTTVLRPSADSTLNSTLSASDTLPGQKTVVLPEASMEPLESPAPQPRSSVSSGTPAARTPVADLNTSPANDSSGAPIPTQHDSGSDNAPNQATEEGPGTRSRTLFGLLPRQPTAESPKQPVPSNTLGDSATDPGNQSSEVTDMQQRLITLSYAVEAPNPDQLTADFGPLVQFDDGRTTLSTEAKTVLNRVAEILRDNDRVQIRVIAHTDSSGSDTLNQLISTRRAEAVATYLQSQDIPSFRITSEGKGKSELKVDAETEGQIGSWINRRIELELRWNDGLTPNPER